MTPSANRLAVRASLLHFLDDPEKVSPKRSIRHYEDGLLWIEGGRVNACGNAADLLPALPEGTAVRVMPGCLIVPGFVDAHIHYPQVDIIASYGQELLDWLNRYSFPAEAKFGSPEHAAKVARFFLGELLRNGTTTALVFGTVHEASVDAFFREALSLDLRMIAGKVLMDRGAPRPLLEDAETGYRRSRELIERWHGKGRLGYAVTPRFALTSSPKQLGLAGKLLHEFPGVHLHTHVSENRKEIQEIKKRFPKRKDYVDVYDHHGLLGERTVLAHGVHLKAREWARLSKTRCALAFCPTSNLFLGSGLFDVTAARDHSGLRLALGTDIGAGTSFSLLQTMNEAYKVARLNGQGLSPFLAFYLATLGGARALGLQDQIGNFETGKEADFLVLDMGTTPLMRHRLPFATSLEEKLFVLMMLGDDRCVKETFIRGIRRYPAD